MFWVGETTKKEGIEKTDFGVQRQNRVFSNPFLFLLFGWGIRMWDMMSSGFESNKTRNVFVHTHVRISSHFGILFSFRLFEKKGYNLSTLYQ